MKKDSYIIFFIMYFLALVVTTTLCYLILGDEISTLFLIFIVTMVFLVIFAIIFLVNFMGKRNFFNKLSTSNFNIDKKYEYDRTIVCFDYDKKLLACNIFSLNKIVSFSQVSSFSVEKSKTRKNLIRLEIVLAIEKPFKSEFDFAYFYAKILDNFVVYSDDIDEFDIKEYFNSNEKLSLFNALILELSKISKQLEN